MTEHTQDSAYPNPNEQRLNPYPVLGVGGFSEHHRSSLERTPDIGPDSTSPSGVAPPDDSYLQLASRLGLRPGQRGGAQNWRFPGQDGVGYGAPRNVSSEPDGDDDLWSGDPENENDAGVIGRPKENVFLQPMRDAERDAGEMLDSDLDSPFIATSSHSEQRGRGRGRASARGRRRGGWKQLLKGTTHDPALQKDDPRRARGTGRRARGRARAERNVDPGREFRDHLQNANQAYFKGNYEEAMEQAVLAVKANPEVFQAHNLLSDSLEKLGRFPDSIAALMCGAHTASDPKVWMLVADRTLFYAGDSRTEEDLDQALFCYSTAVKMQPDLYEARAAKLDILLEKEDWNKARLESKALNRLNPTDVDNKKTYAELCVMTEDRHEIIRAKKAYDIALESHWASSDSFGDPVEQWSNLNVYLELVDRVASPAEGIFKLKKYTRWFLGRKDEDFWDYYVDDDRELDSTSERRVYVPEFQQSGASTDNSRYGDGLPLELRVKAGMFRLKIGPQHLDEALRHFGILLTLSDEVADYYDIFYQVAELLKQHGHNLAAIRYFEPILSVPEVVNADLLMQLGACYVATNRHADAIECLLPVYHEDNENLDVRVWLAQAYRAVGQHEEALKLLPTALSRQRIAAQKHGIREETTESGYEDSQSPDSTPASQAKPAGARTTKRSQPSSGPRRTHLAALEDRWRRVKEEEAAALELFAEVQRLWPVVENADATSTLIQEWLINAGTLIAMFRRTPVFYPKRDHLKFRGFGRLADSSQALRNRIERRNKGTDNMDDEGYGQTDTHNVDETVPQDFRGISFSEWHRIFANHALLSARLGQRQISYDLVKEGMLKANAFFSDPALHNASLAVAMCIALLFNDSAWANNIARTFISNGDYRAGATFQLASALARLCHGRNHYSSGPSQKFTLRMIKVQDALAMTDEMRAEVDFGQLRQTINTRVERQSHRAELDAGLLLLYGHQISAANQSYSAIPYYLRAMALQPQSATALLSMAVMQIQQAMKRQTENRQYGVAMGLAYMTRYCEVRRASGKASHAQEAEYNTGRIWHALGLTEHATRCYERVLAWSPNVQAESREQAMDHDSTEDFATEAALALQNIYAAAGNEEAAMEITETWLVM